LGAPVFEQCSPFIAEELKTVSDNIRPFIGFVACLLFRGWNLCLLLARRPFNSKPPHPPPKRAGIQVQDFRRTFLAFDPPLGLNEHGFDMLALYFSE